MSKIAPYFPPDPYYKQVWQAVTASDGSIYVRMEDEVRLSVFTTTAGLTITLNGIFVDLEGELKPFEMQVVTAGSGTREPTTRFLGPGFLLYCYPTLSGGTPAVGAVTVALELLQSHNTGGPIVKQIIFGSLTAQGFFPAGTISGTVTTSGTVSVSNNPTPSLITQANPPAGTNFTVTVPASTTWRVKQIWFRLTNDANVASRNPVITIKSGATVLAAYWLDTGFSANQVSLFEVGGSAPELTKAIAGFDNNTQIQMPEFIATAGMTINSAIANLQVGDQISGISLSVLAYPA